MGFKVIGVGPGDSELMTIKAVKAIEAADVIIAPVKKEGATASTALSIAKPYVPDMSKVQYFYFPMVHGFSEDETTKALFEQHGKKIDAMTKEGLEVVFLTLGDPSIYCTYSYVDPYVSEVSYIPGIPSFINGAALAKQSLVLGDESLCVLNMTDEETVLREKFRLHSSIVVMKVCTNQKLLKELIEKGNRQVTLMSNIGLENESITTDINALDTKMPYFTIALIR